MKRPFGVTLLALFNLSRAAFFLLLVVMTFARPESPSSAALLQHFMPIPTDSVRGHHQITSPEQARKLNEVGALILVPGIGIFAVIGFGLWFLRKWAWGILVFVSGWMVLSWVRGIIVHCWALGRPIPPDALREILLNAAMFIYLVAVGDAFRQGRDAFRKDRKSDAESGARDPVPAAIKLVNEAYTHALSQYGNKGYEFGKELMERSPITVPHPTDATKEVEITAFWYDVSEQREGGPIQIQVCVPYSTPHGVEPPARSFVVYADGRVVPSEPD
ncbi:MAG: hypothetical protein DMG24_18340 [Acidobacteria bacterium]|nr:MAG: hypothetical protein DMG24_18340 [Acidobacteriota bacterium]